MPKCGDTNYDVDIVSQEINISDDPDILDYWRCLIGRGASPQIVIDLDGPRTTLYINSVVVEDMASLPDIITMIKDTYETGLMTALNVKFTLDTDMIEGDLFGINYRTEYDSPKPVSISVNCKVKSLDCSHLTRLAVSMLDSPTEILEQGSIKGSFSLLSLPLALKNLEENAFAKYSTTEGGEERDCEVKVLFMTSFTVPDSLPQSLSFTDFVYFPALLGGRTYKDYVADVFNIDVTDSKVYCLDISTGQKVSFPQS
jgi:hypothetical protein